MFQLSAAPLPLPSAAIRSDRYAETAQREDGRHRLVRWPTSPFTRRGPGPEPRRQRSRPGGRARLTRRFSRLTVTVAVDAGTAGRTGRIGLRAAAIRPAGPAGERRFEPGVRGHGPLGPPESERQEDARSRGARNDRCWSGQLRLPRPATALGAHGARRLDSRPDRSHRRSHDLVSGSGFHTAAGVARRESRCALGGVGDHRLCRRTKRLPIVPADQYLAAARRLARSQRARPGSGYHIGQRPSREARSCLPCSAPFLLSA